MRVFSAPYTENRPGGITTINAGSLLNTGVRGPPTFIRKFYGIYTRMSNLHWDCPIPTCWRWC